MKRFLAILMAVMLLCGGAMAEEQDWYLDTAMELSAQVGELVRDDNYQKMMTSQTLDCVQEIQDADFTTLKSAYRGSVSFLNVAMWSGMYNDYSGELSAAGMAWIEMSLPGVMLQSYINSLGSEKIEGSVISEFSRTYRMPENFEQCIYLLELDGVMTGVTYSKTGEDSVKATARVVFCGEGKTIEDVAEQIEAVWFEKIA